MLDADLAQLYGVETRAVVQAVKRNALRFPADFMFQLSPQEWNSWRSQTVISNVAGPGRGGRPHATFSRNTRAQLKQVFDAIRELMTPPDPPKRPIGFVTPQDKKGTKAVKAASTTPNTESTQ